METGAVVAAVVLADCAALALVAWGLGYGPAAIAAVRRVARFLAAVVRHPDVPRWVRWLLAAILVIPGPVDECAAAFVLVAVAVRHREAVRECWHRTR